MASLIASHLAAEEAVKRPADAEQQTGPEPGHTLEAAIADAKMRTWEFFEYYDNLGKRLLAHRQHRVERMSENRRKLNMDNMVLLANLERNSQRVQQVLAVSLVLSDGTFADAASVHEALDNAAESDTEVLERLISDIRKAIPQLMLLATKEDEQSKSSLKEPESPPRNPAWNLD